MTKPAAEAAVLRVADVPRGELRTLLSRWGVALVEVEDGQPIPGSYWGDCEAGLIGLGVHVRADTPLHSLLHEFAHLICATPERRASLHTDASDSIEEENASCYLQVLLADLVPGLGRARMLADMDAWGYSFRLGSSARLFDEDADDARRWLLEQGLIDARGRPLPRLRGE